MIKHRLNNFTEGKWLKYLLIWQLQFVIIRSKFKKTQLNKLIFIDTGSNSNSKFTSFFFSFIPKLKTRHDVQCIIIFTINTFIRGGMLLIDSDGL